MTLSRMRFLIMAEDKKKYGLPGFPVHLIPQIEVLIT